MSAVEGMEPETYARVEDHLSSEGIFLMGDATAQGFPIRYASQGFEQLYGFTGSDISMKKCGDLIGGPMILANPDVLATAAAMSQLPPEEAEARIRFLNERAGEACRVMVAHPDERVGVALLVNRKKTGELFVCECLVLCLQHPSLNWSYTVGFQRDISRFVSVPMLFSACTHGDYHRLLQSRAGALEERRSVLLGVGGENVVQYLHEKALSVFSLDIWRTLRSELISAVPASAAGAASSAQPAPVPNGMDVAAPPQDLHIEPPSHALVRNGPAAPPPPPQGQQLMGPVAPAQPRPAAPSAAPPPPPQGQQLMGPVAPAQPRPAAPVPNGMDVAAPPLARYQQGAPGELSLQAPAGRLQGQAPQGQRQLPRIDQQWEQLKCGGSQTLSFLADVGLQYCAEPLLLNGYDDLETILEMTEEDMRAVGLTRGHASKLKRRLRGLKCLQICAGSQDSDAAPTLLTNLYGS